MSGARSKMSRLVKEHKKTTRPERKQLIDTDEITPTVDLRPSDVPAALRKKFGVLMDMQDLMFEEMKEAIRNDVKEMLEKSTKSGMKNSKNRKKWQEVKDLGSQKPKLVEKVEENLKVAEDIENLALKRKDRTKPSKKLNKAKAYGSDQGRKLSLGGSQSHKVIEGMEEGLCSTDARCRNPHHHLEVLEENSKNGEDERAKEITEAKEKSNEKSKYKENFLSTSREENVLNEGAVLRLAADFSSATLEINKQWSTIVNILRENDLEPELLCKVKLSFKCDGEVKTFSDLQSLRKFTSQKPLMKELLKDVFPQHEVNHGGRSRIQEKVCAADRTSDHLNFLFIKEVKIPKSEVKSLGNQDEESSPCKDKETPKFVEGEVSEPEEEEEESSEMEEEGEETSEMEEEGTSEVEEEEEASEVEEEEGEEASEVEEEEGEEASEVEEEEGEEASEVEEEEGEEMLEVEEEEGEEMLEVEEEGEDTSEMRKMRGQASTMEGEGKETVEIGEEREEALVLHKEQNSTFRVLNVVGTQCGIEEITSNGMEISLIDLVVESESKKEGGGKVKTFSQTEKRETLYDLKDIAFSYLVWDTEKKRLVKPQELHKTQGETAMARSQGTRTPCLTLHVASSSKSLEISHGDPPKDSCTNGSVLSQVPLLLRNTEKERHKTWETEELTEKETELIQETQENFRKGVIRIFRQMQEEIGNLKHCHRDVLGMRDSVDDMSSLTCILEERVNNLEDLMEELTKDTMQLTKQIIDKERIREREDILRSSNIRLIGIPEKDNKDNGAEDIIKEVIEENFPELKDSSFEIISAHRIPSSVDEKRLTPRHILVKFLNSSDKQKILRASRKRKEMTYRGMRIRMTADLSPGTLDARSQWSSIIKVLEEEGFEPRILYPAKLAFNFEGKSKVFFDIEEFKKFISLVPYLEKLLGNIL